MSGELMALKVISKINSRIKFLHRKNKFFTPALCKLLCNVDRENKTAVVAFTNVSYFDMFDIC